MKRPSIAGILATLAIAAAVIMAVYGLSSLRSYTLTNPFSFSKSLRMESSDNLVTEIRNMSRLVTAYCHEETAVTKTKPGTAGKAVAPLFKNQLPKVLQDEICIIVKGDIRAGYDLAKMDERSVSVSGDTVRLKLPPLQVFEVTVNPSGIEVFMEDGSWSHEEVTMLKEEASRRILERALDSGLEEQARKAGRRLINNMMVSMGFTTVILTEPANSIELPQATAERTGTWDGH